MSFLYFCRIEEELKKEAKMHILKHVNIVELLAIILETDHHGIVMEYVTNGTLENFVLNHDVWCSVYDLPNSVLLPRDNYAKRGICRRRVSVCVSVCHTPVLYQNG